MRTGTVFGRASVLLFALFIVFGDGYIESAQVHECSCTEPTYVVVSTRDIPAGTRLDPLIEDHVLRLLAVPPDQVVPGTVTGVRWLQGQTALVNIFGNEPIVADRVGQPCRRELPFVCE